jgi:hypothetical protein
MKNTKEDKVQEKAGGWESWQKILEKALAPVGVALRVAGEETEDAANAFVLAVTEGEAAKEKALNQGGSPVPESIAFYVGLTIGPTLKTLFSLWLTQQVNNLFKKPSK